MQLKKEIQEPAVNIVHELYPTITEIVWLQKFDILNSNSYTEMLQTTLNKVSYVESRLTQARYNLKMFTEHARALLQELVMQQHSLIISIGGDPNDKDMMCRGIINEVKKENVKLHSFKLDSPYVKVEDIDNPKNYSCLSILCDLVADSNQYLDIISQANKKLADDALPVLDQVLEKLRNFRDVIKSAEFINAIQTDDTEFINKFKHDNTFSATCIDSIRVGVSSVFRACMAICDNFELYAEAVNVYKKAELQNLLPDTSSNVEII